MGVKIVKIILNCIRDSLVINDNNNTLLLQIYNINNIVTFRQNCNMKYDINDSLTNIKNYFIEVSDEIDINTLTINNFILNLASEYYIVYAYYGLDTDKSLVIFKSYNYFPFIFLGLPMKPSSSDSIPR